MEETPDTQGELHFAFPVEALAGTTFAGAELRELGFPEAEHVGFNAAEPGHFTDTEIELIGDNHFLWGAALGCVSGHGR
jgi:hypothetical protein